MGSVVDGRRLAKGERDERRKVELRLQAGVA